MPKASLQELAERATSTDAYSTLDLGVALDNLVDAVLADPLLETNQGFENRNRAEAAFVGALTFNEIGTEPIVTSRSYVEPQTRFTALNGSRQFAEITIST